MTIQVTDEKGLIHEFPNEATESQIMEAMKVPVAQSQNKPSFDRMANQSLESFIDYPVQQGKEFFGGAAQGAANIPGGLYNLAASGVNALGGRLPKAPMIDQAPHTLTSDAGQLAGIALPGGIANELSKIPQIQGLGQSAMSIPSIAKGVNAALDIIKGNPLKTKAAGGALLGASVSPDHPVLGAIGGGIMPLVGKAADIGLNATKNAINEYPALQKFMPAKFVNELMDRFGEGSKSIGENNKSLTKDIREAHDARAATASAPLNYVKNRVNPNEEIFEKPDPLISTGMDEGKKLIDSMDDLNIGKLYRAYKEKPNFINAHELQSELGVMSREMDAKPFKTPDERNQLAAINDVRNRLKTGINDFLERRDAASNENLAPMYKQGIDYYREHVAPFLSSKKLRSIVRGNKRPESVPEAHDIFKNSTDFINSETGLTERGDANKVLDALTNGGKDPESKNKILYGALGGHYKQSSPNALIKNFGNIDNKGYSDLVSPQLREGINELNRRVKNSTIAKYGAGAVGAGLLGSAVLGGASKIAGLV